MELGFTANHWLLDRMEASVEEARPLGIQSSSLSIILPKLNSRTSFSFSVHLGEHLASEISNWNLIWQWIGMWIAGGLHSHEAHSATDYEGNSILLLRTCIFLIAPLACYSGVLSWRPR